MFNDDFDGCEYECFNDAFDGDFDDFRDERNDWEEDVDGEEDSEEGDDLDVDGDDRSMFADPGGNSALRAASLSNPRNLPCPQCDRENCLTLADRHQGYICDGCANAAEGY